MAMTRTARSDRFLGIVSQHEKVVVVMHDNPDPDAIASGWGLRLLIETKLRLDVRLVGGGEIVRAENRHMVNLLGPPLELVRQVSVPDGAAVILVDCGPEGHNHLLSQRNYRTLVIDHHQQSGRGRRLPFRDVRPRVAASASIVTGYLREQNVEPGPKLATALLYAIRTETRGCETYYSRLDRSVLPWLTERANPSFLAEIEDAPLTPAYFGDLVLAFQNTTIYGHTGFCLLPRAHGPEIVGEVADLLIRCEAIKQVLCGAVVHDDLVFSVRTEHDGPDAAQLVQATLEGIGNGGGHRHRAGGKIPGLGGGEKIAEPMQDVLRQRWLAACNVDGPGERLIAVQDIVENL
jgi:nanoRNase/pAp phosphatase (c-di-AMP/oligoRNAs hydrolase)